MFFFVYEGPTNEFDLPSLPSALLWSTVAGVTAALVLIPTAIPVMKANVLRLFNEDGTRKVYPVRLCCRCCCRCFFLCCRLAVLALLVLGVVSASAHCTAVRDERALP